MRAIGLMLLGALALVACTDLPTFAPGTCGNFVVDPGEDCDDENNPNCQQCLLLCGDAEPGATCGFDDTGVPERGATPYTCGVDGYCHAPSGVFGDPQPAVAFASRNFTITDVDGDTIGDVIAISDTSLNVFYGSADDPLHAQVSTLTPFVRGLAAFGQLDAKAGDSAEELLRNSLDVVIPTSEGIAAYSSPDGIDTMSPHPFAIDLDEGSCNPPLGEAFSVFAIDNRHLWVFTAMKGTQKLGLGIITTDKKSACPDVVIPLCNVLVGNPRMSAPMIDVYPLAAPADPGVVIAARVGKPESGGLCVVAVQAEPGTVAYTATPLVAAALSLDTARPPVLADFDDTGCPSLVLSDLGTSNLQELRGARDAQGRCQLAGPAPDLDLSGLTTADATPIGHLALTPRLHDALGAVSHGKDALVLDTGVYAIPRTAGEQPLELYRSDRAISQVRGGDFDGDGDTDGVAISSSFFSTEDDLDVIRRSSGNGFVPYRIDTALPISNVAVGDYDGDENVDIAFTEKLEDQKDRLLVAYGTQDLPAAPVVLGSFKQVVGLCPIQVDDQADLLETVQDLVVIDNFQDQAAPGEPLPPEVRKVTILHGSAQRTLQSFVDPRPAISANEPVVKFSSVAGVVAGDFFDGEGLDVLAIQLQTAAAWVYPLRSVGGGQLGYTEGEHGTISVGACDGTDMVPPLLCDSARFLSWPRPNAHDVVIALDDVEVVAGTTGQQTRHLMVVDPAGGTTLAPVYRDGSMLRWLTDVPHDLEVRSMLVADLDADGANELVIAFGKKSGVEQVAGEVRWCTVDATGMPGACTTLSDLLPALATQRCVDAAVGNFEPRGRLSGLPPAAPRDELAVLCNAGAGVTATTSVVRVHVDATGPHASVLATFAGRTAGKLAVGDVTGDGLVDLVIVSAGTPTASMFVIPQCAASDLSCQAASDQVMVGSK